MRLNQLFQARQLIKDKPGLIWYTKNYDGLDAAAVTEAVLSYGDWNDVQTLCRIFGLQELKNIFKKLTNNKRVNLRPETVNFFNLYFKHHVPASFN
ncbi:hypothetical protein KKH13_01900 [Patescibacteria group bacterium]|nr:hypothetical protein [Patescibacteria group bacterium]